MRLTTCLLLTALLTACAVESDGTDAWDDTGFAALPTRDAAPPPRAQFVSAFPTNCSSPDPQDIFTAEAGIIRRAARNPKVGFRFAKCDGSAFQTTKTCHVRVGTNAPWGVVRRSFVWPAGEHTMQVLVNGWPDRASFNAAVPNTPDAQKLFYLTCDDGSSPAHWRQGHPVAVEKL